MTTENIKSRVVFMTPEWAQQFLVHNTKNRDVRRNVVEQYSRDMRSGHFSLTGQPIILDSDGTILDGQHRLMACVKAEVGFWTLLVENIAPSTLHNIDTGAKRTFADYLAINGVLNAKDVASVCRLSLMWARGGDGPAYRRASTSNSELIGLRDRSGGAVDRAAGIVARTKGVPGLRWKRSVIGAVAANLLYGGCDENSVAWFTTATRDGTAEAGSPAALLYERLLQTSLKRGITVSAWQELALTVKAWNAQALGVPIAQLKWRTVGPKPEAFPVLLDENGDRLELMQ